ncbi:recQ-mediated genome instability protein 1-like [Maniola hyperantus]|uniref:recQ-mediated genome instability protein 1-like n=1 Tax=Aphantopus hyperantus TaxID=2795564 RepID=UPI00156A428E|nr:recQ-mediated genome instability protein 1-like [Maniola hyperantus]
MTTMSTTAILNSVRNFLASLYMLADEDWISGCVNYFMEESGCTDIKEIQSQAKEQWLLNNLTDICPGSLPANLSSTHKTCLIGRFVLQINAVCDIGTPAYQQYLKLQKVNTENIDATTKFDDKVPSHRMIKLCMTDGKQEVAGIEYKPMRNLSLDITPGCKVLIKGPVECRRGMLLLTESCIELLGGEASDLSDNTQACLLSDKLGLPVAQETNLDSTLNHPRNTNIPSPHTQMPPPISEPVLEPTFDQTSRPIARVTGVQVSNFADDDIDFDELNAIEAQYCENRMKRPSETNIHNREKKLKTNPTHSTNRVQNPSNETNSTSSTNKIQNYFKMNPTLPTNTVENHMKTNPTLTGVNTVEDYPDDADMCFEDEDYLREIEAKLDAKENEFSSHITKVQIPVSSEPFVYIKQIENLSDSIKVGRVFKVKGQILKLLSKLSVSKEGWTLRCTIVDGTGSLDVDFTSDVLSKLVGYTPQEMIQLRKQIGRKPEIRGMFETALQQAKIKLEVLYCIIELTMLETPKITRLIPFEDFHVDSLKSRLQASGL